jgi:5'-3' exonuclease
MEVHLVDGTYELFRHFFSPGGGHRNAAGDEIGAVRGVLRSVMGMLGGGATHLGVATDHVITSWRNDVWPGYKTGEGIDPDLWVQFPLLEEALVAAGVTVWPMVEYEADDAMASAAVVAAADPRVERAVICTPDKDLSQCVRDPNVIQYDRRADAYRDEAGVRAKFGVEPGSIPDYLALVGDSADGFPGLPGWGAKSTAAVLSRYPRLEDIPHDVGEWDVDVRGAAKLVVSLRTDFELALLFRRLATLDLDVPVGTVDDWQWRGPTAALEEMCERLDAPDVLRNAQAIIAGR